MKRKEIITINEEEIRLALVKWFDTAFPNPGTFTLDMIKSNKGNLSATFTRVLPET